MSVANNRKLNINVYNMLKGQRLQDLKRQVIHQSKYENNKDQTNFRDVYDTNSGVSYRQKHKIYKINFTKFPKVQDQCCWKEGNFHQKPVENDSIEITGSFVTDLSREIKMEIKNKDSFFENENTAKIVNEKNQTREKKNEKNEKIIVTPWKY